MEVYFIINLFFLGIQWSIDSELIKASDEDSINKSVSCYYSDTLNAYFVVCYYYVINEDPSNFR